MSTQDAQSSSEKCKEEKEDILSILSEALKQLHFSLKEKEEYKPYSLTGPDNKIYSFDPAKLKIMKKTDIFTLLKFPNRVTLKESQIHGKGVFAITNIPKGSLVTFYPADILSYYPNTRPNRDDIEAVIASSASERLKEKLSRNKLTDEDRLSLADYQYDIDQYYSISGSPSFTDPGYLGHYINDCMTCIDTKKSIDEYVKEAPKLANCRFSKVADGLHLGIIATRDILEGEELFVNYGASYWVSHYKRFSLSSLSIN